MDFRTGLQLLSPYASALQNDINLDVSHIKGNVSEDAKRLSVAVFRFFISDEAHSYSASVGQRLKPLEINIFEGPQNGSLVAETIFEIQVEHDMCNVFDTMHGACAAFIIDPCSSSSLVSHGLALGVDGTGVSQSMTIIWHRPVRNGAQLRIVSRSMSMDGRIRTARCEVRSHRFDVLWLTNQHLSFGLKINFAYPRLIRLPILDASLKGRVDLISSKYPDQIEDSNTLSRSHSIS